MWREEAKPRLKPARPNAETVPCSAWVAEVEAAIAHLKKAHEMTGGTQKDYWLHCDFRAAINHLQARVDAERCHSATDKLRHSAPAEDSDNTKNA